ncbi:hypothetical protein [Saccharopolyspora sp. NPDC002376]
MTVILARRTTGTATQRVVHAWPADQTGDVVRALCGATAQVRDLERCGQVGMPCEACTFIAVELAQQAKAPASPRIEREPAVPYAVDRTDSTMCHDVPEIPTVESFDGQLVVVTACGVHALLKSGTPTGKRCPECRQQHDVAQLDMGRAIL